LLTKFVLDKRVELELQFKLHFFMALTQKERTARYLQKHPGANYAAICRWRKTHPETVKRYNQEQVERTRCRVLDHYGCICRCCGETHEEFLTLAHVNEDGAAHRKKLKRFGAGFYAWLVKNNFPNDVPLEILCWNCNCAIQYHGGICPHKTVIKSS